MFPRGQTVGYRNPDELPVLYAVPAPRYPGLINVVNVPPPTHPGQQVGKKFLTVASDGSVIGVQHAIGYIDHEKARHCGTCLNNFDGLLKPDLLPEVNTHTCNVYPPVPKNLTNLDAVFPELVSPITSTTPNSEIFRSCPPIGKPLPSMQPNQTIRQIMNLPGSFNSRVPIIRPISSVVCSSPTSLTPSTHSQSYPSQWRNSTHVNRCGGDSLQRRFPSQVSVHRQLFSIPEKPPMFVKKSTPIPDARQKIAAMLNARKDHDLKSVHERRDPRSILDMISHARIEAIERDRNKQHLNQSCETPTPTRPIINLPNRKRSRKSRPFRIQVVTPINSSEPLDLSEVSIKKEPAEMLKQNDNLESSKQLTKNTDTALDLTKTSNENLKITAPTILIEPEFPPNIQRMTPIDKGEALDLSKHGSKREATAYKSINSDQSLSPPCLEKITTENTNVVLDLSTTSRTPEQPIDFAADLKKLTSPDASSVTSFPFNCSNKLNQFSCNDNQTTQSFTSSSVQLPKIENVFTLNKEAVRKLQESKQIQPLDLMESNRKNNSMVVQDTDIETIIESHLKSSPKPPISLPPGQQRSETSINISSGKVMTKDIPVNLSSDSVQQHVQKQHASVVSASDDVSESSVVPDNVPCNQINKVTTIRYPQNMANLESERQTEFIDAVKDITNGKYDLQIDNASPPVSQSISDKPSEEPNHQGSSSPNLSCSEQNGTLQPSDSTTLHSSTGSQEELISKSLKSSQDTTNGRPKRTCRVQSSLGGCRHIGCIGCNFVTKRVVQKSPKKTIKRKINHSGSFGGTLKIVIKDGRFKSDLRSHKIVQPTYECLPMDLSKSSKQTGLSSQYAKAQDLRKSKHRNIIKFKKAKKLKIRDILCLKKSKPVKSIVLGGKAPVVRLQKLTEQDVLDLSGYTNQTKLSQESIGDQKTENKCVNEDDDFKMTRPLNEDCGKDTVNKSEDKSVINCDATVSASALPDIENDLFQLTSGFDE